jgi:hypothetical protein
VLCSSPGGCDTARMGRQVRYKNHPEDLAALWTYLESVGGVVLGQPTATPEPHVLDTLDLFEVRDLGQRREALIARRQDLSSLQYKFYETRNFWLIDKLNSPVVEYSPGYDPPAQPFSRADRRRGRMWFATTYLEAGHLVSAPEDFVIWANRILQWVKRNWSRCDDYYQSPTAANRAE